MSGAKLDAVRRMIDAWNEGDLDDVRSYLADGMEWREVEGNPEFAEGEVRGKDEIAAGFERLFETWQSYRLELDEIHDAGDDRVVAVVREVARGRASGVEVAGCWGYVIVVSDGKLARVDAYRDAHKALREAGLSEAG